jgi:hypothetical protein
MTTRIDSGDGGLAAWIPAEVRRAWAPGRDPGNLAGTLERWESKVSIDGVLVAR